jgi:hypothetical protein
MSKKKEPKDTAGAVARFEPGGVFGPVEDRNELDRRLTSLPAGEKELAEESARFADFCQYFERQKWMFLWRSSINSAGQQDFR